MVAITPNAKHHAGLAPLMSRFVHIADMPWEKTKFPGVETKTLLLDKWTGLLTVLLRMAPGAKLPDHEHVLIEQTFVLEGRLVDGDGECAAGDYVWRPAGSRHEAWCPDGGLMIAMFQSAEQVLQRRWRHHRHARPGLDGDVGAGAQSRGGIVAQSKGNPSPPFREERLDEVGGKRRTCVDHLTPPTPSAWARPLASRRGKINVTSRGPCGSG